jgi:hypothetical protein
VWKVFNYEREGTRVVGVCVRDENVIRTTGFVDGTQVGKLVVLNAPARAWRNADSHIYQQQFSAYFNQSAACTDFIRAAQKGELHTNQKSLSNGF